MILITEYLSKVYVPTTTARFDFDFDFDFDFQCLSRTNLFVLFQGNLEDILRKRVRLDLTTALRYALDIAR